MKFSTIRSILFLSCLTVPFLAFGIDPTTSGRIIDAFKKQEYAILFETFPFDHHDANEVYEKEYILN
jgi:hypothetical protein